MYNFYMDELTIPVTYDISFHSGESVHYVCFFDRYNAHEFGERISKCVDVDFVDMLNGETGEVLYHYKGKMS